jgi:S1-C subfamily serine protease
MDEQTKFNLWLMAIIIALMMILIGVGMVSADVRTAPVDSLVRISIGHPLAKSGGSGFLIGDYTIITAKHVVDSNDVMYFVQYSDGQIEMVDNRSIVLSNKDDIAMFQVSRMGTELKIQDTLAEIGDDIYVMGHPWFYRKAFFSTGIVGSERMAMMFRGGDYRRVVMMDVSVVSGMSGCPVFNMDDEVVGVAVGGASLITVMVDSVLLNGFLR